MNLATARKSTQAGTVRARRLKHVPALDGLRGAAVVGVLLFHAGHLTGGYLGVDLFFVLSGYLITSLLVAEWTASGGVALGAFWSRRARRLLPALLAMLVVIGVASHWFVPPISRGQLRGEGLATLGYVANWFAIFRGSGYWQQTLSPSWLQHTWSLAIEEQFYVIWPLVAVVVLGRRGRVRGLPSHGAGTQGVRRLAGVAWVGALVSAGLMIALAFAGVSHERLYLGTDTRVAAIMLGAGLACSQWLVGTDRPVPVGLRWAIAGAGIAAAGVLMVAWTVLSGTGEVLYRGGLAACSISATVLVLDVTTPGRSLLRRALAVAPLRWLGRISYGLYLWHWPIFQYLHVGRFGLSGWPLAIVQIATSVAVATLSYRLIEQPLRRGALPGRLARGALMAGAAAAAVALLIGTTGSIDPTPNLADPLGGYTSGPSNAPRLMMVGDSVGLSLASDGLGPLAQSLGVRVLNRARVGCTIMRHVPDPRFPLLRNCSPQWPAEVQRYRPDVVVVLFGLWSGNAAPLRIGDGQYQACDPPWQQRWHDRFSAAIDSLAARGAKVVLVSAPTTDVYYQKGRDPALFDRQQDCSNHVLAQLAQSRPDASFVDLAHYVCPQSTRCREKIDGATLRPDALHFRGAGAEAVARWLVPRVLAAASRP